MVTQKSPLGGAGDNTKSPHHSAGNRQYNQPSLEELKSSLYSLDPNRDRDYWTRAGMAYKAGGGDFETFDKWSQGGATYNAKDSLAAWKSFDVNGGIKVKTLFKMANDAGWRWKQTGHRTESKPANNEAGPSQNDDVQIQAILKGCTPADPKHDYLVAKKIQPHGAFQLGESLVIPIQDESGIITGLQKIAPDGSKRYAKGTKKKGSFYIIGATLQSLGNLLLAEINILICEGFATGASLHEATGNPVVVSLDSANLVLVAEIFQRLHPSRVIIFAADDDRHTPGNPGLTKATEAARITGARLAVPVFDPAFQGKFTDFNDLHQLSGLEAVREQILAAKLVEPEQEPEQRLANDDEQETVFRCLADVQAEPIQWLWPGRIAKRKLTLEAGDPGLGKSQISLDHAAVVSTGGTWPDGSKCANPGNVIIISVEDDAGDTIKPRLEACGADMSRIFILEAIRDTDAKGRKRKRGFNLQEDLGRLEKMIAQIGGADLITIDPISAYVGTVDSYKNSDVRALLGPLTELASRHEAAVVAVSHLAKSGSSALTKISGSLGFIAAARAGYLIAKDPGNNDRRLFLPVKNNVGVDSSGFAYRIESASLPSGIETSKVVWEPGSVTLTADEVLAAQCASQEERTQLEEAKEFLADLLQHGPVEAMKIKNDARGAGISERTLNRAKTALDVRSKKEPISGRWKWSLPPFRSNPEPLTPGIGKLGIHGNVGNLGNVGTHASPTYHKYNINNNSSSIPSKGVIQHCQDCQHCQEIQGSQLYQELDYEEF
ncbi:MAG: AAA family ATPase [Magnetococcales bacterium]|nr:AAA family ATPase [Magnetococcales bacterium]